MPHRDESETETGVGWVSEWTLQSRRPWDLNERERSRAAQPERNKITFFLIVVVVRIRFSLFRPPLVRVCHSLVLIFLFPPRWGKIKRGEGVRQGCGGGGGFIFFCCIFFESSYPKRKRTFFKKVFCCQWVSEDVGAEHYGPDNCSPAQCNGIRRVENSMQGHHSRSNGPEEETFGLWVSFFFILKTASGPSLKPPQAPVGETPLSYGDGGATRPQSLRIGYMLLLVHVMADYSVLTSRSGLVDIVLYIIKRVLKM